MTRDSKVFASDAMISLANKLPSNLCIKTTNDAEFYFSLAFLYRLNDEQLSKLRKEADKKLDTLLCLQFANEEYFKVFDWTKFLGFYTFLDPSDTECNTILIKFVLSDD